MDDDSNLFNRNLYRLRRQRRAGAWKDYNFLKTEAAMRIAEKLDDVARRFAVALDLGCHGGEVAAAITHKADSIISTDLCHAMHPDVVCDEEFLPFAADSVDLITSALSLHHANDLPGVLLQAQRCLKPDGLLVAILPGANTLRELRESITAVSAGQGFPLVPRLSPLVEVRDAGALLQRAGFALPVVDSETLVVEYDSVWKLFRDLQGMGESNVLYAQFKGFTSRAHLGAVAAYYEQQYAENGLIPASFELVAMTGWKPHSSQQIPAKRGSGRVNLKQVL